jgi:hypothetical protein
MRHADCVHRLRYTHSPSREQVSQHPSPSVRNGEQEAERPPTLVICITDIGTLNFPKYTESAEPLLF